MQILHNSTPTALWHDIIHEAELQCDIHLKEDLESYLVFLLMRYTTNSQIIKKIVATDFLTGMNLRLNERQQVLQEVGDNCLIYTGLFPAFPKRYEASNLPYPTAPIYTQTGNSTQFGRLLKFRMIFLALYIILKVL